MGGTGSFAVAGQRMAGCTWPRAAVTGRLAVAGVEREVAGSAWLDHQWGDWIYADPGDDCPHPMWNYYGVLLDDGRSLVVYETRRPEGAGWNRAPVFALLWERDGRAVPPGAVAVTPLATRCSSWPRAATTTRSSC